MKYDNVTEGIFLSRPNRFIAKVLIDGAEQTVHVKNTGRCRELLVPNCKVYLQKGTSPARKTAFDLIAVLKERAGMDPLLINMDSQAPNKAAEEWIKGGLFSGKARVQREVTFNSSRFDLFVQDGDREAFVEVKGVTLEEDGVASFPDAPTQRGIKHINELIAAKKQGFEAYILFVVQMKGVKLFTPNDLTHPEFGKALREAAKEGVGVLAYDCMVDPSGMSIDKPVQVMLAIDEAKDGKYRKCPCTRIK